MSANRHLPWLWESIWANTLLQSPGWRAKDHTPEPLVAAGSGLLGIFYCFECIESTGSCARTAAEPRPAAGGSWLGAVLARVWERTEPSGLQQPTKSWPQLTARAAVCIYKLLTKTSRMSRAGTIQLQLWLCQTAALSKRWEKPRFLAGDALWYSAGACLGSSVLPKGEIWEKGCFRKPAACTEYLPVLLAARDLHRGNKKKKPGASAINHYTITTTFSFSPQLLKIKQIDHTWLLRFLATRFIFRRFPGGLSMWRRPTSSSPSTCSRN